ncbi:MAG: DUF1559 domain-containing protein [Planctomycetota bacterium]
MTARQVVRTHSRQKLPRGFTLIELVAVIGIIAILVALALPAVQSAREATRRSMCSNRMRQIGVGLHNFHTRSGRFPSVPGCSTRVFHWVFEILPELEQNAVYEEIRQEFNSGVDWAALEHGRTSLDLLMCPSNPHYGEVFRHRISSRLFSQSNYIGVAGIVSDDGMFPHWLDFDFCQSHNGLMRARDITDGLSSTLAVGERPVKPVSPIVGAWLASQEFGHASIGVAVRSNLYPSYIEDDCSDAHFSNGSLHDPCSQFHHWSLHPGGSHFLMADGAMRFMSYSVDGTLLEALSTIRGGEMAQIED